VKIVLRSLGVFLIIVGLILICYPELIGQTSMPTDAFSSIEQRIKWGFLIGLGILLLLHHQLKPWRLTASAILFSLTLGFVTARFIGIILVGLISKQLFWLGVEIVALLIFGLWYRIEKLVAIKHTNNL
jgi:hypothetical protein